MKFKTVSPWWVMDEISKGKKVKAVDKAKMLGHNINNMAVEDAVEMINDAREHPDRYEFWYEADESEVE